MSHTIMITVENEFALNFDTDDEFIDSTIECVEEFASGLGVEVDVDYEDGGERGTGTIIVAVTGTTEDVGLVSRRWYEE